jgi:hypothetical protein
VTDEVGTDYSIHFVALFSEKPDAIPIVMLHGWPGITTPDIDSDKYPSNETLTAS